MAKTPNLSYVAELSAKLLKAKADVKRLQVEWDALFQVNDGTDYSSQQALRGPRTDTKVSKIIDFLDQHLTDTFTTEEIHDLLSLDNKQSTGTTLSKLVKKGRVKKVGADQYASINWVEALAEILPEGEP